MKRPLLAGLCALVVMGAPATLSGATFPGRNGSLAYDAKIGKRFQLFTSKSDGSASHQLTRFANSDSVWATWSPNGKQIAFERDVYKGVFVTRAAIYTMNADGTRMRVLTPTGFNGRPSWSPDGRRIVYSTLHYGKQATISVMAANGTGVKRLMYMPLPEKTFRAKGGKQLGSPTFSPDGKRIAFILGTKKGGTAIYTMKATGCSPASGVCGLKQVTPLKKWGVADKIDWSPDGTRIAFSSPGIGDIPGVSSNVFTVRSDGTGLVKLTRSRGGKIHNGLDSWSPNGKKIAFVSNRSGKYEIYVMNANGSGLVQVTRGPEAHRAAWGTHR